MDKVEFLSKTPLFESCSQKNVKSIAEQTKTRKFSAGEEIITEGSQKTMGFYLVLEGEAKVSRAGHHLGEVPVVDERHHRRERARAAGCQA